MAGLGHPGEVGGGVDGLGERTVRKKEKAERGESDMGGRERECGMWWPFWHIGATVAGHVSVSSLFGAFETRDGPLLSCMHRPVHQKLKLMGRRDG